MAHITFYGRNQEELKSFLMKVKEESEYSSLCYTVGTCFLSILCIMVYAYYMYMYIKKRWQEYTEELYKKDLHDPDNHDGEPDILQCEVK